MVLCKSEVAPITTCHYNKLWKKLQLALLFIFYFFNDDEVGLQEPEMSATNKTRVLPRKEQARDPIQGE